MSEFEIPENEKVKGETEKLVPYAYSNDGHEELNEFKNITKNLMQDALKVWSELWAEIEGQTALEATSEDGIKAEKLCDCREFLFKMWRLRHYLLFAKSLSNSKSYPRKSEAGY